MACGSAITFLPDNTFAAVDLPKIREVRLNLSARGQTIALHMIEIGNAEEDEVRRIVDDSIEN